MSVLDDLQSQGLAPRLIPNAVRIVRKDHHRQWVESWAQLRSYWAGGPDGTRLRRYALEGWVARLPHLQGGSHALAYHDPAIAKRAAELEREERELDAMVPIYEAEAAE